MNKFLICRTCLSKQDSSKFKQLTVDATYNNMPILPMIKLCIPELDINVRASHHFICMECIQILSNFFSFKTTCLKNNSKYKEYLNKSYYTDKHVPSTENNLNTSSTSNNILNNDTPKNTFCTNSYDSLKANLVTFTQADVNQNEVSKDENPNTAKRKTFTFYRKRFMNESCSGCKNRLLDVRYHSKVYNGYYDCFNCGKRLTSIVDMRKHIYTHTLSYKCEICGKQWRGRYALEIHLRSHTKQKPFECPVCNKKFVQSYSLQQHLGIHQGHDDNKNRCSICDKVLSTKYNLKIHMTSHNSDSRHKCLNPNCNKWYYTNAALTRHYETCPLNVVKEEEEDVFIEPEFIKTELHDSVKEEEIDSVFVEESSRSVAEKNQLANLKFEHLEEKIFV